MNRKKTVYALYDIFIFLFLISFSAFLIFFPKDASSAAVEGIKLSVGSVFPSLFPFFVISSMLIDTGILRKSASVFSKLAHKLFGISGIGFTAVVLGAVGGYPLGVKTAVSLYDSKLCSLSELKRLLIFCNNSGPAFITGFVGAFIFNSVKIGFMLYLCHIFSALLLGVLLNLALDSVDKAKPIQTKEHERASLSSSFIKAVSSGMSAMLSLCGFVIFFGVFIRVLSKSGIIDLLSHSVCRLAPSFFTDFSLGNALVCGFFEMTNGLKLLLNKNMQNALVLASFLLGWGGWSVHFQAMTFMSVSGISPKGYIIGKLFQGVAAAFFTKLWLTFFPLRLNTFYYENPYAYNIPLEFYDRFLAASLISCLIFTFFALLSYFSIVFLGKRHYNVMKKRGVDACFMEKE